MQNETQPNEQQPDYTPNHIPIKKRLGYIFAAVVLVIYTVVGLINDDISLSSRQRSGFWGYKTTKLHFHGIGAWVLGASMLCIAATFITMVADHYDKRNNQIKYDRIFVRTASAGILLFLLAGVIYIFS